MCSPRCGPWWFWVVLACVNSEVADVPPAFVSTFFASSNMKCALASDGWFGMEGYARLPLYRESFARVDVTAGVPAVVTVAAVEVDGPLAVTLLVDVLPGVVESIAVATLVVVVVVVEVVAFALVVAAPPRLSAAMPTSTSALVLLCGRLLLAAIGKQREREITALPPGALTQQRMFRFRHVCLKPEGRYSRLETKVFIRRVAVSAAHHLQPIFAPNHRRHYERVKDKAGQHDREQRFTARLQQPIAQLFCSLANRLQLIVTERDTFEQCEQIRLLVGKLHLQRFGAGRRPGHFQPKQTHAEREMVVFGVFCQHRTEEGALGQGGRREHAQLVRDRIDVVFLALLLRRWWQIDHQVWWVCQHFRREPNAQRARFPAVTVRV
uniref:Secreted protein n=1 Tax=Anopheles maculatus TaxID=74869 RepID=A0A182SNN5_9DIPT